MEVLHVPADQVDINSDEILEQDLDSEDFYFESDHLALRGNEDYRNVLRTIVILEAQKIEATKHIDRIASAEKTALNDPEAFVARLASGTSLDLPGPINIVNLPKIKFEKYNVIMPTAEEDEPKNVKNAESNDITVRGRVFDQTKPETFNQLWTCEEQRRLEELLIKFDPEPIEMRRFAKIARALGNRTTKQVASRLQKYFQKLHAAGLPVPGRVPRGARNYVTTRKHRVNNQLIRPTTFFPSNYVPVNITDEEDGSGNFLDPKYYRNGYDASGPGDGGNLGISSSLDGPETMIVDEQSDSELTPNDTDHIKMIRLAKRVKRDKEKNYKIESTNCDHMGFKCDFCNEEPITGTRWHCMTCNEGSIDFCSDCLISQLQTDSRHSLDHKFLGLRVTADFRSLSDDESYNGDDDDLGDEETVASGSATPLDDNSKDQFNSDELGSSSFMFDKDYAPTKFAKARNKYNYMDPNFLLE